MGVAFTQKSVGRSRLAVAIVLSVALVLTSLTTLVVNNNANAATLTSVYRMNAGGPAYTDRAGKVWRADEYYQAVRGAQHSVTNAIANTEDDFLFQSERWWMDGYRIPIANGPYTLRLSFAEISPPSANRVFSVSHGAKPLLTNFTPAKEVGNYTALVKEFQVDVTGGVLDLKFTSITNAASIAAIELLQASTSVPTTTTSTFRVQHTGKFLALDAQGRTIQSSTPTQFVVDGSALRVGDKCLDTNISKEARPALAVCNSTDTGQRWDLTAPYIAPAGSNFTLDVEFAGTQDGAVVELWDKYNAVNQKWTRINSTTSPSTTTLPTSTTLPPTPTPAVWKIMPLGDSITEWAPSYRPYLYDSLVQRGAKIDFVGSMKGAASADPDHEGHAGWRNDQLAAQAKAWTSTYQPDMVLVHAGTNDLVSGATSQVAIDRLRGLLTQIYAGKPNTHVVMAGIVPIFTGTPEVEHAKYVAATPGVVAEFKAKGFKISFVDLSKSVVRADFMDNVHPNATGSQKMAAAWLPAVLAVIQQPLPTTTTTAMPTTTTLLTTTTVPTSTTMPPATPGKPGVGMMVFVNQATWARDLQETVATGSTWIRMDIPPGVFGSLNNGVFVVNQANADFYRRAAQQADAAGLKIVLVMAASFENNAWTEAQFRNYNGQYWKSVSQYIGQYVDLWQIYNEHDGRDYRNHAPVSLTTEYLTRFRDTLAAARVAVRTYSTAPLTTTTFGYPVDEARYAKWQTFFDGVGPSLDVIGIHAYPEKSADVINRVPTYINRLKARYNKPVAVLEYGLPSVPSYGTSAEIGKANADQIRAIMGASPMVATLYQLRDRGTDVNNGEMVFGILRNDFSRKDYYPTVVAEVKRWR